METLLQDIRYGIRMVAKSPGFAVIAILTLALGIGANTALFSVVNGVLLNPLPYEQPDRLVAVYSKTQQFSHSSISYPNFLDWVRAQNSFSEMAAFREDVYKHGQLQLEGFLDLGLFALSDMGPMASAVRSTDLVVTSRPARTFICSRP
jgi:hypothetical protein